MLNRGIRRSLIDFRRHPWLHLMSVATLTAALVIAGGFLLGYRNFESLAERTNPQITGTIYLKDAVAESQVSLLKDRILTLENVLSATFKSRTSVVADLNAFLGAAGPESLPGTELFPDVVELQVRADTPSAKLTTLKAVIAKFPEVAEVDFSADWVAQYKKIRQLLNVVGFLLLTAILVGCSFITANFMGMRHQARKNEIDIVRLIGAHQRFILTPFLWEGLIEGFLASSLAFAILYFSKSVLSALALVQWASFLGVDGLLFLSPLQAMGVFVMGILMACCGSFTVFLRFKESSL